LNKIVRHTNDLSIFTDGERRYGNLLFEICYELVKNGQPGRPKKTLNLHSAHCRKGLWSRVRQNLPPGYARLI